MESRSRERFLCGDRKVAASQTVCLWLAVHVPAANFISLLDVPILKTAIGIPCLILILARLKHSCRNEKMMSCIGLARDHVRRRLHAASLGAAFIAFGFRPALVVCLPVNTDAALAY